MHNLLIVDDEWIIAKSISTMDEWFERNINVIGTASNGIEALAYIEKKMIDIMIVDIQMPEMDGLELLKRVREINPSIQFIMISGYEEFQYVHTAIKYKARGYMLKPIDTDELFELVDEIILEFEKENLHDVTNGEDQPLTPQESLVLDTIDYLKSNLDKQITLQDVAQHFSLSPQYFGQLFKNASGENYSTYLTKIRMEKACELLKDPELKIYQICREVGYMDVKYFSQQFQRYFNMKPTAYRKQYFLTRKKKLLV